MVGNVIEPRNTTHDLNDNEYWGALLNDAIPNSIDYREIQCYGIMKDNKPVIAWAYHSFLSNAWKNHAIKELEASVSIASFKDDWKPFKTIKLILSLFFKQPCYNRLTATTHASNGQAVRLVKLAGFTLEGIQRKPSHIEDILQFSLLREDWERSRWATLK